MDIRKVGLILAFLVLGTGHADAFQSGQHEKITTTSIDNIDTDYPDLIKFRKIIAAWSWGIGPNAGVPQFLNPGNPAEQLAHLLDQTQSIEATGNIDGGNFTQVLLNINADL